MSVGTDRPRLSRYVVNMDEHCEYAILQVGFGTLYVTLPLDVRDEVV